MRSGSFNDTGFFFGQGKIDSYYNRQPAWGAVRSDFIEKRSRIRSRRRSVQPPLHIDEDFFLMNSLSGLISDAFCI